MHDMRTGREDEPVGAAGAGGGWDSMLPDLRRTDQVDRAAANRAIAASAGGLALTGLIEIVVALMSGSVGLLSDALHNLSDVSTSAAVFVGLRVSRRPATSRFTYGYERAEDLAGVGVALAIWASAVAAGLLSIRKLTEGGVTAHPVAGMFAAAVGIVGNALVGRYKRRVGTRIHSATLVADAEHSRLDAASSLGALLGLVGVALGWRWADAAAGLVITALIVHVAWEVTADLVTHLLDGVDPEVVKDAESAAASVAGVRHAHVRARWSGRSLLVEVEGFVDPGVSVADAERIGQEVETAVGGRLPAVRAILWSAHPL